MEKPLDVAIVGAGLSGLACAHALQARGAKTVVFEAEAHVGGKVQSIHRQAFVLENGPHAFLDNAPRTQALIDALGLRTHIRDADPAAKARYILKGGRLRRMSGSPLSVLSSGLLRWRAFLRAAREPWVPIASPANEESLADFTARRFGAEVFDLVDAAQTGVYAGDPRKLSHVAFPQLHDWETQHGSVVRALWANRRNQRARLTTLEGGLKMLTQRLGESLGDTVRTGVHVNAVKPVASGFLLESSADGTRQRTAARNVVLALPAFLAARLTTFDDLLSRALMNIPYAPIAVVHLAWPRGGAPNLPAGFGYLAPESEGHPILGAIFVSAAFPWRAPETHHLVTCLIGGVRHPERVEQGDEALTTLAKTALRDVLKAPTDITVLGIARWRQGIPQYVLGHANTLRTVDARLSAWQGLHVLGHAYRGAGVNDCLRQAHELGCALPL
ncbi:MAG: protoporphyrinogen oxidase [Myxococcaceae bacterium]